ncbi:MAG: DUF4307 domain-containing protein [Gulosibacter sp.]|uniref:DUF4307 domain-containing protein n=1 Tax=Gulosibacter sp. TaxID=2817531 RepID=UPI003F8F5809
MSDLEARYGASRRRPKSEPSTKPNRLWWVAVIVLLLGTIGFWALTFVDSSTTVESQTARFESISATEASIEARVSVKPGEELVCAVEAQNALKAVVGYELVELPAITEQHRVLAHTLRTTQPADVVLIRECWIP